MILGQQTILKFIFIVLLILALSSCASIKEEPGDGFEKEPEMIVEEAPSVEADVRQPIYVYENHPERVNLSKVFLKLNAEPLLLPNGYVRLAGVVSGGRPMALVEVGGRGIVVGRGDQVCGYKLISINKERILLKR